MNAVLNDEKTRVTAGIRSSCTPPQVSVSLVDTQLNNRNMQVNETNLITHNTATQNIAMPSEETPIKVRHRAATIAPYPSMADDANHIDSSVVNILSEVNHNNNLPQANLNLVKLEISSLSNYASTVASNLSQTNINYKIAPMQISEELLRMHGLTDCIGDHTQYIYHQEEKKELTIAVSFKHDFITNTVFAIQSAEGETI
ncbi:hypothetical protein ACTFIZ_008609 [Dictyostelium cf. discoideum]